MRVSNFTDWVPKKTRFGYANYQYLALGSRYLLYVCIHIYIHTHILDNKNTDLLKNPERGKRIYQTYIWEVHVKFTRNIPCIQNRRHIRQEGWNAMLIGDHKLGELQISKSLNFIRLHPQASVNIARWDFATSPTLPELPAPHSETYPWPLPLLYF